MSAWIYMIGDTEADAHLRKLLDEARTPHGTVDNVMRVHSLRPATMQGHVALYRAALHNDANTLPAWLQETLSSYVSILNDCHYSLANHWANARHLMDDEAKADAIERALKSGELEEVFSGRELALLNYTRKLTCEPQAMVEADIQSLRREGLDDGQILEANQIVAYFNYVNRLLNGLGVSTDGDIVGYYAGD
ncbi:MAG: carboxymuconolactone decarboxylase family protein [Granulosicoccus sp.]